MKRLMVLAAIVSAGAAVSAAKVDGRLATIDPSRHVFPNISRR